MFAKGAAKRGKLVVGVHIILTSTTSATVLLVLVELFVKLLFTTRIS